MNFVAYQSIFKNKQYYLINTCKTMKQQLRTDAELESMLSHFHIQEPEEFCCEGQKKITNLCINPGCKKQSLHCNDQSCKYCNDDVHQDCHFIKLKGITKMLEQRTSQQKVFISDVCEIQNAFVNKLHKSRQSIFYEKYRFGDLQEKYLKIVEKIYNEKDRSILKGKQAQQFCKRLENFKKNANLEKSLKNMLLNIYEGSFNTFLKAITELKKNIYNHLSGIKEDQSENKNSFEIQSQILKKFKPEQNQNYKVYLEITQKYKKHLTQQYDQESLNFMMRILDNPKKITRLFKASDHQFKAAQFHAKCDGKTNTLVLAQTQHGKVVGGFTSLPWSSNGTYGNDATSKNFIFSLNLKEKFVPVRTDMLIYGGNGYGPNFGGGGGGDIHIANEGNKSKMNFPLSYNRQGENKITNNQDSYKMFSGATSGSNVSLIEYEVFQVIYQ